MRIQRRCDQLRRPGGAAYGAGGPVRDPRPPWLTKDGSVRSHHISICWFQMLVWTHLTGLS